MVGLFLSIMLINSAGRIMLTRVYYQNDQERLQILSKHPDILAGRADQKWFDILMDEEEYQEFKDMGIKMEIQVYDMDKFFEEKGGAHIMINFGKYYTFDEMQAEINQIAQQYPNITKLDTIGWSWYNRPILAMKISDNPQIDENEPKGLFTGVHHAREPIGCSITMDFIKWLCENYNQPGGRGDTATFLVNEREIWIVPVVNPDGYVYNEQYPQGMWRKNQRDNDNNGYFNSDYDGVDLNRNYGYMWGYDDWGSSPNPSDETYRGPSAFSEPETQAIRQLCNSAKPQVAINFHSYSNVIITPWGYIDDYPPEPDKTIYLAMADTMSTKWNGWTYGNSSETIGYTANGDSDDWMYGEQNEKPKCFAYTFEVGSAFWEAVNDTNIILQQIAKTRPCMIYLLYKAQNFVDIKEKIYVDRIEFQKSFVTKNPLKSIPEKLLANSKIYDPFGRKIKNFGKGGVYILKTDKEVYRILYLK